MDFPQYPQTGVATSFRLPLTSAATASADEWTCIFSQNRSVYFAVFAAIPRVFSREELINQTASFMLLRSERDWLALLVEVYNHARGPARKLELLSWAVDPSSGERWPVEWAVRYGKRSVFTYVFGHVWQDAIV